MTRIEDLTRGMVEAIDTAVSLSIVCGKVLVGILYSSNTKFPVKPGTALISQPLLLLYLPARGPIFHLRRTRACFLNDR